ncbi:MAG TPA: Na+/H+ antiporter subunit D [Bacteroidales bacterium]|nr:Na+/H+ antiporter subunit D [Bacteroidales bacterium]
MTTYANILIAAPVLFPMLLGLITLALWNSRRWQQWVNVAGSALFVVIGLLLLDMVLHEGIQVMQSGNWRAPFGISLVADVFSAVMVVITSVMAFAVAVYSISSMGHDEELQDARRSIQFAYYPLLNIMYMGINGAFLTGDIFNLYVWFEVMLISSFVLLSLGQRKFQLEGTFKYVSINLLSSTLFLIGVGLLYALTGTLNMADLAVKVPQVEQQGMVMLVAIFFLIAFGIKSAVFPLFFWLPASYHTPPISISAIFAGLLTKVGVYSLIRVFSLIFITNIAFTHNILLWIAGFTMVVGVMGAAVQYDMRRILSFHIISQIGYMVMGLALFSPLALAGAVFYIMHHIIVKANLFLIGGLVERVSGQFDVRRVGGLLNSYPLLAVLFLIPALSLAGIPPLSGFWSKFLVIKAGIDLQSYFIVFVALFVGLLTLFSMIKIWNEGFWAPAPTDAAPFTEKLLSRRNVMMVLPVAMLAGITLWIGFNPEPFFQIAEKAANQLINPQEYITKVLGGAP